MSSESYTNYLSSAPKEEGFSEWSAQEQQQLLQNMNDFPQHKYSVYKWLTLLLTNLKGKRLRDVRARVDYIIAKESDSQLTWSLYTSQLLQEKRVRRQRSLSENNRSARSRSRSPSVSSDDEKKPRRRRRNSAERTKGDEVEKAVSMNSTCPLPKVPPKPLPIKCSPHFSTTSFDSSQLINQKSNPPQKMLPLKQTKYQYPQPNNRNIPQQRPMHQQPPFTTGIPSSIVNHQNRLNNQMNNPQQQQQFQNHNTYMVAQPQIRPLQPQDIKQEPYLDSANMSVVTNETNTQQMQYNTSLNHQDINSLMNSLSNINEQLMQNYLNGYSINMDNFYQFHDIVNQIVSFTNQLSPNLPPCIKFPCSHNELCTVSQNPALIRECAFFNPQFFTIPPPNGMQ